MVPMVYQRGMPAYKMPMAALRSSTAPTKGTDISHTNIAGRDEPSASRRKR